MKRFLKKIKREKSPKPPQHPTLPVKPVDIGAGPPDFRTELDDNSDGGRSPSSRVLEVDSPDVAIPPDEGGRIGPRILFQDGMDANQQLRASGAQISDVVIDDDGCGSLLAVVGSSDTKEEIEQTEACTVAKEAHEETPKLGGAKSYAEKFGPLKAALGNIPALCANHEETSAVGNKVSNLLSRIVALEDLFDSPPSGVPEQRRRVDLIRKLDTIREQLRLFSEKSGLPRPADHVQASEDAFQLLEDTQEAILDYQTMQQTMVNNQGLREIDPAEAAILNSVRCAQQAGYRHGNRNGCLRGTRTAILDEIELWIRDFDKPPVYWLNGLAGTGKSTIAQTIAERTFADGRLGASFFCSRDFEDRRNLRLIFPTLAVQLARKYPRFRSAFIQLVQSDPEIVHESLYNQMKNLMAQPLVESTISTVIVIDALDECQDKEPASAILSVLGQFVAEVPNVKFFITGRPESRVREGFRLPLLVEATDVFVLHEVELGQVSNDIRLFFRHSFSELKRYRRELGDWPSEEQVNLLCERAAGLFVHAVATFRFIDEKNNSPKKQLDRLLQSQESSILEGKTKLKANEILDSLYTSILKEAYGDDDPENDPRVRSILGAVVLAANPLSPSTIAALLGFELEEVLPLLSSLRSLLILQDEANHPVRPFHKSFPDFIVDPARCADPRFRVYPPDQHADLLFGCLETMNRELKWNICRLPDGVVNSEVADLRERTDEHIGQALEYACRSWYRHLVGAIPAWITPILHRFLEEKFIFWLEVLSILGAAKEAVHALEAITKCEWVEAPSTLDLVRDYSRFIITFFEVISLSAPHIYHSALPLSPQTSIVRELYKQYIRPLARVVRGLPSLWDPTAATLYSETFPYNATWSPCNRIIATINRESVVILDATTLSRLDTFAIPCRYLEREYRWPSFSPDGHCLTIIGRGELISWDLQTGGPLGAIPSGLEQDAYSDLTAFSSTYSEDGKVVAVAYSAQNSYAINHDTFDEYDTFIRTYNLSGTVAGCHCVPRGRIIAPIWTNGKCVRFVTISTGSVVVLEVEFTLKNPPVEVESLPIADKIAGGKSFLFLPSLSRLAFIHNDTIQVWDAKAAELLLKSELPSSDTSYKDPPIGSFSSDGSFFAHVDVNGVARVWKESPAGYVLHQKLPFIASYFSSGPYLSPSGESIFMSPDRRAFYLWHTRDQVSSLPSISASDNFTLAFSPDERFAAFARREGNVVTIFNPLIGDSQLAVDTDMGVMCLGMTRSALAIVGKEKIVTWDLPVGDCAFNTSINDSVRTTTLHLNRDTPKHGSISPDFSYIAVLTGPSYRIQLKIYDMSTGRCLTSTRVLNTPQGIGFTRDGREVWTCYHLHYGDGWKIVEGGGSGPIQLEPRDRIVHPSGVFDWESCGGYEVRDDGWVLSATQKRLLWLPHRWRSHASQRAWSGRFLGLLQRELSEVVILEFPE